MAPEGKNDGAAPAPGSGTRHRPEPKVKDANVGDALKSAYQQTVNEAVPDDLLDLLGRLS